MILNNSCSNIFNINLKGADIMNNKLNKQFVKVPSRKLNKIANRTVDIDSRVAMNELLKNPKLIKTLQKLSLV